DHGIAVVRDRKLEGKPDQKKRKYVQKKKLEDPFR
ncbi:hypothetical protein THAOC_00482, partial [Thalassiosira oceanica]